MKSIITLMLCLSQIALVANTEKEISSKINKATVFLNGAQVYRKGKTKIPKGTSKFVFTDISPYLHVKSIQATATGSPIILDVKHRIHYTEPPKVKPVVIPERIQIEIKALEDSLLFSQFELELIKSKKQNLINEKKLITSNKTMRGEGRSDSLPILMQAVDFYRKQLTDIETLLFEIKIKEKLIQNQRVLMTSRVSELKNYNKNIGQPVQVKKKIHQIVVTLASDVETYSDLGISYLVDNASWKPSYDLRAEDKSKPVELTYKASVVQHTGEDWDNVKLTLSTYNQSCNFSIPSLAMWELWDRSKKPQVQPYKQSSMGYNVIMNSTLPTEIGYDNGKLVTSNPTKQPDHDFLMDTLAAAKLSNTFDNVEFEIKNKYSIASQGGEILMVVNQKSLPSNYSTLSIPKINKDCFLLAKIHGWEEMNLLQAKANIYFKNTYVGETYIDPHTLDDTLSLALNREKGFLTDRKKISDREKVNAITKNVTRTIEIELVVKNTRSSSSKINIKDQIPITKNDKIDIKLIDDQGAELNSKTGELSWDIALAPKETKKIVFKYRIEYDKEMNVL